MNLSDGEKLIAVMLADLMQAQKVSGEVNPEFIKEAIFGGDLWALEWEYEGIFENDEPAEAVIKETVDILTMCSFVEYSIKELKPEQLAEIDDSERIVFVGFDGNHDDHFGVARMFVSKMNRWNEFSGHALNSHGSVLPKYRKMKAVYDGIGSRHGGFLLEEIQAILGA